jgi:hypothetical protein
MIITAASSIAIPATIFADKAPGDRELMEKGSARRRLFC